MEIITEERGFPALFSQIFTRLSTPKKSEEAGRGSILNPSLKHNISSLVSMCCKEISNIFSICMDSV